MLGEPFSLEQNTGPCPTCGAELQHPGDEYELDDDGVPSVVPGLGFWCAACGWDELEDTAKDDHVPDDEEDGDSADEGEHP